MWAPRSRSTSVAPAVVSNRSQKIFKGSRTGMEPRNPVGSSLIRSSLHSPAQVGSSGFASAACQVCLELTGSLHALRRLAYSRHTTHAVCFVSIGCFCQVRFRDHWRLGLRTSTLHRVSSLAHGAPLTCSHSTALAWPPSEEDPEAPAETAPIVSPPCSPARPCYSPTRVWCFGILGKPDTHTDPSSLPSVLLITVKSCFR